MNETTPPNKPANPATVRAEAATAPAEVQPIRSLSGLLQALLREPGRVRDNLRLNRAGHVMLGSLALVIVAGAAYGLVVGSFSGGTQWWASPLKIVLGVLLSALICLPSLYIMAALSGATSTLRELAGIVAGAAALMTILLMGLAPVAWVFSQSTQSVSAMAAVHFLFWAVSLYFGLRFLSGALGRTSDRAGGVRLWIVIYLLVMFQMTTALRPLIGTAKTLLPTEKKFFLAHWADTMAAPAAVKSGATN